MGTLFVVGTPIGNLEDVSLRALRVLKEVALIAAEDTRTTRKLLQRYGIRTPLISYFEGNRQERIPELVKRLESEDVALVSEAGVPGIRDPGLELVKAVLDSGCNVVPIPGPSAVTTALSVAGMSGERFVFLGFLPSRKKERQTLLQDVSLDTRTLVLFESPHRLQDSLADMERALGVNRPIAVCRELTKLHEEVYRGTIAGAREHFTHPRGEFTLVVEGLRDLGDKTEEQQHEAIEDLRSFKLNRAPVKEVMVWMAREHGLTRRQVYQLWLELDVKR